MNKLKIFFILTFFIFSQINFSFSQSKDNFKVGVVEVETILKELPEAIEADKNRSKVARYFITNAK